MTDNVVILGGMTKLDIPPDRVLQAAIGKLDSVVIIGYDEDGDEYFASSCANPMKILWLVERFKKLLLENKK